MTDSIPKIKFPELFFGFVAPIGADIEPVLNSFKRQFGDRGYRVVEIKATTVFRSFSQYLKPERPLVHKKPLLDRYETYIAYGNQLRAEFGDEVLAATSIRRIMRKRLQSKSDEHKPFSAVVYLLHQFKRPEEISLLRSVYGRLFFQVSVYSRKGARVSHLSSLFARSENTSKVQDFRAGAERLINDDENQRGVKNGQRVAKIFSDADVVFSLDDQINSPIEKQVLRFEKLIFGSNCISPTRQEYGMFLAKAAALRSLDLSRQVGAAVFSQSGEVLSLGSNEVPRAKGGTYWTDEKFDDRDYVRRIDSNFQRKKEILLELTSIIAPGSSADAWLSDPKIKDSQFMDALEYGRMVHAEMSAISDATRLGHAIGGSTLYCTTFPCHMCAKHIVASGIEKVVFLEPYPKSLASDLHSDSLEIEGNDRGSFKEYPATQFIHFYGVTPRRYRELFERKERKNINTGTFNEYICSVPEPMMDIKYPFYNVLETRITSTYFAKFSTLAPEDELLSADE